MSNPASAILGEVSELTQDTVSFNATHTVSGASGAGHFDLITSAGLSQYLSHFADVELLTDSLTVSIRGPVTATIATTLDVCVIPAGHTAQPATAAHIATVQGSAATQHSLLVGVGSSPLRFSNGVTTQLKPVGYVGDLPRVCYFFQVHGGNAQSSGTIVLSGRIRARGIGFVQTW
jgi:hypothetical protein